jgi:hypothetical protein
VIALAMLIRLVLFVLTCRLDPHDPDGNGPRTLRPSQLLWWRRAVAFGRGVP